MHRPLFSPRSGGQQPPPADPRDPPAAVRSIRVASGGRAGGSMAAQPGEQGGAQGGRRDVHERPGDFDRRDVVCSGGVQFLEGE